MPADVVGIAASTLARLGYSATEQFLLKSILYAMEHPKLTVGVAGAAYGGLQYMSTNQLNISLPPDAIQPSFGPIFDFLQMGIQTFLGGRDIRNEIIKNQNTNH
jgi:hypothetical protein